MSDTDVGIGGPPEQDFNDSFFPTRPSTGTSGSVVSMLQEAFINPNQLPWKIPVPVNGGDTATVSIRVQEGTSFAATVWRVYPSTDGRTYPTMTALGTISSATTAVTVTCKGMPFIMIVLETASGVTGQYHGVDVVVTRNSGS